MTMTVDTYAHYMGQDADKAAIARINLALGDATGTSDSKLRAPGLDLADGNR